MLLFLPEKGICQFCPTYPCIIHTHFWSKRKQANKLSVYRLIFPYFIIFIHAFLLIKTNIITMEIQNNSIHLRKWYTKYVYIMEIQVDNTFIPTREHKNQRKRARKRLENHLWSIFILDVGILDNLRSF